MRERKNLIAFPVLIAPKSFAEAPGEIHVVPCGIWDHPSYGLIEITAADIAEIVRNFNAKVRLDLPITAGHDNGMSGGELPAIGWFKELIDRGTAGLYGTVEWTEEGKKLLTDGAFKYFSPELYMQYEDPETHRVYNYVLVGGALTNSPYFKELEPVVMSFSESSISITNTTKHDTTTMDIKTLVTKKVAELNADEKAFLKAHKSELSAEQAEAFKSVFAEKSAEEIAKEEGDANEAAGKNRDGSAKEVKGSEKKLITMSETDLNILKEAADKGVSAFAELEKMKIGNLAGGLIFSETNKAGRVLPKEKDAVVAFMSELTPKQRDQFVNIVNKIPAAQIFGEKGTAEVALTDKKAIFAQIEAKAKELMKADAKLKFSAALSLAQKQNPELAAAYDAAGATE